MEHPFVDCRLWKTLIVLVMRWLVKPATKSASSHRRSAPLTRNYGGFEILACGNSCEMLIRCHRDSRARRSQTGLEQTNHITHGTNGVCYSRFQSETHAIHIAGGAADQEEPTTLLWRGRGGGQIEGAATRARNGFCQTRGRLRVTCQHCLLGEQETPLKRPANSRRLPCCSATALTSTCSIACRSNSRTLTGSPSRTASRNRASRPRAASIVCTTSANSVPWATCWRP